MKPRNSGIPTALTLITIVASGLAGAASDSWNINSDGLWLDPANWAAGTPPGSTTLTDSTDIATFGLTLTGGRFVAVDANRNIGGIIFSNTSASGYTLLSGGLRVSNGGVIQSIGTTGAHTDTIATPIEIQGDGGTASFTNASSLATRLMNIGPVTGISTGANVTTMILNGDNLGKNALSGIVGDGSGGGKLNVTKNDAGTWSLQNAGNTYTGGTFINAGTIEALTTGTLGSGSVTLSGGQLHLINNTNTAYGNNVLVTGNATIVSTKVSGQTGNISHTLGTLSIGANTLTLAKFFNTTAGTLTFGNTTLTANASFATNASTNLVLGATSGDFSITKGTTGATGTLILAADNSYSGGTNISVGTIQAGNGGTTGNLGTGAVSIATDGTLAFSRNGAAMFSNAISGVGGVRLNNASSIITLTNAAYTGSTLIQNGVLQSNSSTSNFVLGAVNATFNYGVLGLLSDFNGALGTAPGNISWTTGVNVSGGFAVMDAATRSVNIGGNVVPETLTVGSAGFVGGTLAGNNSRIAFGDVNSLALGTVDFKNPINLGSGDRSLIMVVNGAAPFASDLTGTISGSGVASGVGDALVKFGNGNIRLSGNNTYTGRTVVGGQGSVILNSATAFSPNTWLHLDGGAAGTLGGILGLGYDLNADLGLTGGKVHFAASGGFAAFGGNRSVTLNSGSVLIWASTTSFVANAQNFILGQAKASGKITLTNGIDLNDAERTIHVNDGTNPIDAELSGSITGAAGGLTKSGTGTLALSGISDYAGITTVSAGKLLVNGTLGDTFTSVSAPGTLGGSGVTIGFTSVSGTLAPGQSIGSLGTGYLSLATGSVFSYELNSTLITGDLAHVTDLDVLEGATLSVTDLSPTVVALGTKLTMISYSGTFNDGVFTYQGNPLPNGGSFAVGPNRWQIKYDDSSGGSNFAADQTGATGRVTLTAVENVSSYDTWAQSFGIDPLGPNGGPGEDFDGDNTSNLAEFRLGLIPNSGSSRFAVSITGSPSTGFTLTWPSQPGLSFSVKSSTTLASFTTLEATVPATASPAIVTSWTSGSLADPRKFFRVEFTPAP